MALDTGGAAIVCEGVDVWAGNNPLILDVNWSIMPGERWAIQGTNGCGKSTLLYAGYVENEASMAGRCGPDS